MKERKEQVSLLLILLIGIISYFLFKLFIVLIQNKTNVTIFFVYMFSVLLFLFLRFKFKINRFVLILFDVLSFPVMLFYLMFSFALPAIVIYIAFIFYIAIPFIVTAAIVKIIQFFELFIISKNVEIYILVTMTLFIVLFFHKVLLRLVIYIHPSRFGNSEKNKEREMKELVISILTLENLKFTIYFSYFIFIIYYSYFSLSDIENDLPLKAIFHSFISFLAVDNFLKNSKSLNITKPSDIKNKIFNAIKSKIEI